MLVVSLGVDTAAEDPTPFARRRRLLAARRGDRRVGAADGARAGGRLCLDVIGRNVVNVLRGVASA